jgi:asparagine synthase (glutamine-hydrolysing)
MDGMQRIASPYGATVSSPLLDDRFVAALTTFGRGGPGTRTEVMRRLFGDLLPDPILSRRDKAGFTEAFFGPTSKQFAREWTGAGIPAELVDAEALREVWLEETPDFRSAPLLQLAWLNSHDARDIAEPLHRASE